MNELFELLRHDIFTDAQEYRDRVRRVKDLVAELALKDSTQKDTLHTRYREAAKSLHEVEGEVEIDSDAIVSISDDPGAYVQAWVWVSDEEAGISRKDASLD